MKGQVGAGLLQKPFLKRQVTRVIEQRTASRLAVASRAPSLLVVGFDAGWKPVVGHEAHVRLVDSHSEGDGCAQHPHLAREKPVLAGMPQLAREPGVVGGRVDPGRRQLPCQRFGIAALPHVHDGAAFGLTQQLLDHEPLVPRRTGENLEGEIRPVEALDHADRVAQLEALDDVIGDPRRGGRGEGQPSRAGKGRQVGPQLAVLGSEVVAPLRDAVRLVDGEKADPVVRERLP